MTEPILLVIHYDLARISPNKRVPHAAVMRQRCRDAKLAAVDAWRRAGCPTSEVPVRIDIAVSRAMRMDDDNIVAAFKKLRDALCCSTKTGEGIVPNDTPDWVRVGAVFQDIQPRFRGREEIALRIVPLEE